MNETETALLENVGKGVDALTSFQCLFGVRENDKKIQEVAIIGKVRARPQYNKLEKAYLAGSIIALTISLGITIQRFTVFKICECDFAFGLLLLLTIIFCYYYVIHSILVERWDELFIFVASKGIVTGYCIVNYINGERDTETLIRLILSCIAGPILIILGFYFCYQYYKSNRFIHDVVGTANEELQTPCRIYYVCSSLLKFDLQIQWSMLILTIGKNMLYLTLGDKIVFGSGVPVILLVYVLGRLGISYENNKLMIAFYIMGVCERGFIAYCFYYTYTKGDNVDATYNPALVCVVAAFFIWISLFVATGVFVQCYFGKGLKEKLHGLSNGQHVEVAIINGEPSRVVTNGASSGYETTDEETTLVC
ncbi:hypothetical protein JTE90_005030 [Oedothorax gibbosus]|uniref:DUF7789 domain-containing protein n=1 Tax=Oedothorax gibbosus TaxID=931172 RepID=A0AAV6VB82_9ARAC|nr:hypothetical protein JTE90_005030 [Oedothorax gibbosus]